MSEEKNIKTYDNNIRFFVMINVIIGIISIISNNVNYSFIFNLSPEVLGIACYLCFPLALNYVLSDDQKACIIFLKKNNAYPSYRAFTEHINNDDRIINKNLEEKYGELPIEPLDNYRLWYKIYRKHSKDPRVFKSQQEFLLFRDCTVLTLLFIIPSLMLYGLFYVRLIPFKSNYVYYILFLILEFLVFRLAAKNCGEAFIKNVLATESLEKKDQKEGE